MATYFLHFDPEAGAFWLFQEGQTLPLRRHRIIVETEEDLSITINAVLPLSFDTDTGASPLTFLPANTLSPTVSSSPPSSSSVTIELSALPAPSDVVGFWLNMNNSDPALFNMTSPIFFITAATVELPPTMTLTYDPPSGNFTLGNLPSPLAKTDILYRLELVPKAPGNQTLVTLESTDASSVTFFNPAILWSDGTTTPPTSEQEVILDCPFVSGRALGMQFAISYNGALIYSPDPIIMDKQIGDNGQP